MTNNKTKKLVIVSLFTALVAVATMAIKIPTINGYIHLGDTLVYITGAFLGPILGPLAAGLGSLLADILSGYPMWAFPSFIIKALDALVFALILKNIRSNVKMDNFIQKYIAALILGGSVMVGGYFITSVFLYSFEGALGGILPNIVQAVGGGVIAYPIMIALIKQDFFNKVLNK